MTMAQLNIGTQSRLAPTVLMPALDPDSVRWLLDIKLSDMAEALKGFDLARVLEATQSRARELADAGRHCSVPELKEASKLYRRLALRFRVLQAFNVQPALGSVH